MLVSVHDSLMLLHGDMCAFVFDRSEAENSIKSHLVWPVYR